MGIVLSVCDLTGNATQPWEDAGHTAVLVDPQHERTGWVSPTRYVYSGTWEDFRENGWPVRLNGLSNVVMAFGFPPCTDLAASGARWWKDKAAKDPNFQTDAAAFAVGLAWEFERIGCPWVIENPVGRLSTLWRKPDHYWHPWQFTAHCADDNYTKKTGSWVGGGYVPPALAVDTSLGDPDNRIHFAAPGPERANFRSATPKGWAMAVFLSNGGVE